jgi:hypothetical protein
MTLVLRTDGARGKTFIGPKILFLNSAPQRQNISTRFRINLLYDESGTLPAPSKLSH